MFGGFDLNLNGISPEVINDFDKLPWVVELVKDFIE